MTPRSRLRLLAAPCALALAAATLGAQAAHPANAPDYAAIVGTVQRFHQLLVLGDSAGVTGLLAPDLTVLEGGALESRSDYLAHHLAADFEFARALAASYRIARVAQSGDAAWVVSTSTTHGQFKGRQIDSRGAELMVLSRSASGWRIRSVHWSSGRISP